MGETLAILCLVLGLAILVFGNSIEAILERFASHEIEEDAKAHTPKEKDDDASKS